MAGWKTRIGPGAALVLAITGATALQARPASDETVPLCDLVMEVDSVPIQAEPVTLSVRYSASFGDTVFAILPEESKIRVVSVAHAGKDNPRTLRITLNTSEAVPGWYELIADDGQADCRGWVQVVALAKRTVIYFLHFGSSGNRQTEKAIESDAPLSPRAMR